VDEFTAVLEYYRSKYLVINVRCSKKKHPSTGIPCTFWFCATADKIIPVLLYKLIIGAH
jgi:hypothetical protein